MPSLRRRLTLRFSMLLILLFALALGGYGEIRRQLAAKALVEGLATWTPGNPALVEVKRLHAEKTAARWLAAAIRADREGRKRYLLASPPAPGIVSVVAVNSGVAMGLLKGFGADAAPAVPELIRSVNTETDEGLKAQAIDTLASFVDSNDRVFHAVVAQFRAKPKAFDEFDPVGQSIQIALGFAKARRSTLVPILIGLIDDPDPVIQTRAILTLSMIGQDARPAAPALLRSLRSSDFRIRAYSVRALARAGPANESVRQAILRLAQDKTDVVRSEVRNALEILDYQIAVAHRADELRRVIASDRALGGKPRPKTP